MSLSWHPDEVSKLLVAEKSGVLHIVNAVSFHSILSLDCGGGPLSSGVLTNSKARNNLKRNSSILSMMNAKLSQQRFRHCHENGLIKMIQTIPHNLHVSFKLTSLYCG